MWHALLLKGLDGGKGTENSVAVIGATAARKGGHLHDLLARIALSAIMVGACLFAADLARRGFGGAALFPRAAPTGGWFMLGGWLGLAVAAVTAKRS